MGLQWCPPYASQKIVGRESAVDLYPEATTCVQAVDMKVFRGIT
jgi:hypothetical protein